MVEDFARGKVMLEFSWKPSPAARRTDVGRLASGLFNGAAVKAALLASVLAVAPGAAALADEVAAPAGKTDQDHYRQAIFDAAVKKPSYDLKLKPIDATKSRIKVITLTYKDDSPIKPDHPFTSTKGSKTLAKQSGGKGVVQYDTWVSLPSESGKACKGAKDPVRALEQILGMPPAGGDWELVQFEVAPRHMFRPCASSPDITTKRCSFTLPTKFKSKDEKKAVEAAQAFVFAQIWNSDIRGFPSPGYPFTGMGWTYNWDPASKDHYGISEYIVRAGAPVRSIRVLTPKQFCKGG